MNINMKAGHILGSVAFAHLTANKNFDVFINIKNYDYVKWSNKI